MKPISEETYNNVVSLLDRGLSARKIATELGVSRATVDSLCEKSRPDIQKSQGGQPTKLKPTDKHRLVRMITSGKVDSATQVTQELRDISNVDVSTETVRRALKESGLKAVTKKKKPRLLPRHIRQRLDFARKYQHWTVEDWKRVVWSDETKINRLGSDGREWVWKTPGGVMTEQHIKGTVKFGGGSLMMWGCMTALEVGYACRIDGRMDAELYTNILGDEFLQSLEYYGMDVNKIIFQQDNDPKHTSHTAQKWFENNGVEVLDWSAQSPDLNPIEHLWQHLKRQLAKYENSPVSIYELWERVETEWNNIPPQICLDLIASMPRRVDAVLKAKGGYTKY